MLFVALFALSLIGCSAPDLMPMTDADSGSAFDESAPAEGSDWADDGPQVIIVNDDTPAIITPVVEEPEEAEYEEIYDPVGTAATSTRVLMMVSCRYCRASIS